MQSQAVPSRPEMAALFLESPRGLAAEASSPGKSPRPSGSPRKKAGDGPGTEAPGVPDDAALRSMLLSPLELKTAGQKRTQAFLLRCLVQSSKVSLPEVHLTAWLAGSIHQ